MTLSLQATDQARRDAGTKLTVTSGSPQAMLGWFLRQSWKVKFLLASVLMFCGYAAFNALFDPADPARTCPASMPVAQRAKCIIEMEDAAAERERVENARQAAEDNKIEAEEKVLEDEKRRQRNLARAKPLKEAFDRRLSEVAAMSGPIRDFAARLKLIDELHFQLFQIMRLSDHPLNSLPDSFAPARLQDVDTNSIEARTAPPGRAAADAALMKACKQQPRLSCAEALKTHMLKLPYYSAANYISVIVP